VLPCSSSHWAFLMRHMRPPTCYNRPSYFFFQLKVGRLAEPLAANIRHRNAVRSLLQNERAFWASENFEAFITLRSSQPGNQRRRLAIMAGRLAARLSVAALLVSMPRCAATSAAITFIAADASGSVAAML
jgi:hypothetical protein